MIAEVEGKWGCVVKDHTESGGPDAAGEIVLTSKLHLQGEPELGTVAWEKKIQF
jgi:hypothetical protein